MPRGAPLRLTTLILALLPGVLQAQLPRYPGDQPTAQVPESNPLAVLLDHADSLALTDWQVAILDNARQKLDAKNRPLMEWLARQTEHPFARTDSIRAAVGGATQPRRPGQAGGQPMQSQLEPLRAVRIEIQDNNRRALEQVRAHLTLEQWDQGYELIKRDREARARARPAK